MYIYSEAFKLVVYVPATEDLAEKAAGVTIWLLPNVERNGENDFSCIDNEFNTKQ